jgi:hypothetical protein
MRHGEIARQPSLFSEDLVAGVSDIWLTSDSHIHFPLSLFETDGPSPTSRLYQNAPGALVQGADFAFPACLSYFLCGSCN